MASLKLKEVSAGLVVAKPVTNLHGVILIPQGTEVTERNVWTLKSWGVDRVWVAEDTEAKGSENDAGDDVYLALERKLREKFVDVSGDPVMEEIMRVAMAHMQKRVPKKKTAKE